MRDIKAKERRERRGGTGETSDSGSQPHCAAVQHLLLYSFANYEGDSWPPRSSPHNAGRMGRDVQPGLLVLGVVGGVGWGARIFTPSSILICRRTEAGRKTSGFTVSLGFCLRAAALPSPHTSAEGSPGAAPAAAPDDTVWAKGGGVRKRAGDGGGLVVAVDVGRQISRSSQLDGFQGVRPLTN